MADKNELLFDTKFEGLTKGVEDLNKLRDSLILLQQTTDKSKKPELFKELNEYIKNVNTQIDSLKSKINDLQSGRTQSFNNSFKGLDTKFVNLIGYADQLLAKIKEIQSQGSLAFTLAADKLPKPTAGEKLQNKIEKQVETQTTKNKKSIQDDIDNAYKIRDAELASIDKVSQKKSDVRTKEIKESKDAEIQKEREIDNAYKQRQEQRLKDNKTFTSKTIDEAIKENNKLVENQTKAEIKAYETQTIPKLQSKIKTEAAETKIIGQSTKSELFDKNAVENVQRIRDSIAQAKANVIAFKDALNKPTNSKEEIAGLTQGLKNASEAARQGTFSFKAFTGEFVDNMKRLALFQAEWYATKFLVLGVVEAIAKSIGGQLKLGKAVAQVGSAADMTTKQMEQFRKQSIQISNEVPTAANEVAKAGFLFAQSGMDFETISKAMPLAAKMVVTTGEDMKVGVSALTTAFFAWKLQAKDLPATADMITAAMQASKMEVKDLDTVFNYLATTAKTLNTNLNGLTSIKDTLTLAATLSQAGVKPSTIGTGLSNAITSLLKASKDANSTLGKILTGAGIDLAKVDPTKNRLIDIFKTLSDAPELTLVDVFNGWTLRGGRSVSAILNQATKAIDIMDAKISEKGILEKMFTKSTNNVLDQLKILQNKFSNIFQISTEQEGGFIRIVKIFQTILDAAILFRNELIVIIGLLLTMKIASGLTTSITDLITSLGKVRDKIYKIIGATEALQATLSTLGKMTVGIAIVFGISYVVNKMMDKTMAEEAEKAKKVFTTFTKNEIEALKQVASTTTDSKWTDVKINPKGTSTDTKNALIKLEKEGLGRVSRQNLLKQLDDFSKPTPEQLKEPEVDRSGPGQKKTSTGGVRGIGKQQSAERLDYRTQIEEIKSFYDEEENIYKNARKRHVISEEDFINATVQLRQEEYEREKRVLETHLKNIDTLKEYEKAKKRGTKAGLNADEEKGINEKAAAEKLAAQQALETLNKKHINKTRDDLTNAELLAEKVKEEKEKGVISLKQEQIAQDKELLAYKVEIGASTPLEAMQKELQYEKEILNDQKLEKQHELEKKAGTVEEVKLKNDIAIINKKLENNEGDRIKLEKAYVASLEKEYGLKGKIIESESQIFQLTGQWKEYYESQVKGIQNTINLLIKKGELLKGEAKDENDSAIALERVKEQRAIQMTTPMGAFDLGLSDKLNEFKDWGKNIKQVGTDIATALGDTFNTFFSDLFTGSMKNASDYLKSLSTAISKTMAKITSEMLMLSLTGLNGNNNNNGNSNYGGILMKFIMSMLGGSNTMNGGSYDGSMSSGYYGAGSLGQYHSGGEVVAKLKEGEFVHQESAVKRYGRAFMSAVNAGTYDGGGTNVKLVDAQSLTNLMTKMSDNTRDASKQLSQAVTKSGGGSGGNFNVNVINNGNNKVSTTTRDTPSGPTLDVIIDTAVANKIGTRGSSSNTTLRQNFGAKERLVNR